MIVAVANNKGGVAKTTTVETLGAILASTYKKRVLLIDLDAQQNLTNNLLTENPEKTVYDFLLQCGFEDSKKGIYEVRKNLFLIAGSENLENIGFNLYSKKDMAFILKKAIQTITEKFDYILIDCPPGLGILPLNALVAAEKVIIPVIPEVRPLEGLVSMTTLIEELKQEINPDISLLGVLITRFNRRKINRITADIISERYRDIVFNSVIRENITVTEAPMESATLIEYAPDSIAATDYKNFTKEFINKTK